MEQRQSGKSQIELQKVTPAQKFAILEKAPHDLHPLSGYPSFLAKLARVIGRVWRSAVLLFDYIQKSYFKNQDQTSRWYPSLRATVIIVEHGIIRRGTYLTPDTTLTNLKDAFGLQESVEVWVIGEKAHFTNSELELPDHGHKADDTIILLAGKGKPVRISNLTTMRGWKFLGENSRKRLVEWLTSREKEQINENPIRYESNNLLTLRHTYTPSG